MTASDDDLAVTPDMQRYYLNQRRRDREVMAEAVKKGDFETVRRLSHKLKGSGALYGFPDLTRASRALNDAAKREDAAAVRAAAGDWNETLQLLFDLWDGKDA